MSEGRDLGVPQVEEIWELAKKRWGDPGRRTPPPDKRFIELREILSKLEKLLTPEVKTIVPSSRDFGQKIKVKRQIVSDFDDDEIPF